MKSDKLSSILLDDIYTVGVRFRDGNNHKTYTYKVPKSVKLEEHDLVIVDAPYSGVTVVDVVRVDKVARIDVNADFKYKFIMQKVDVKGYQKVVKADAELQQLAEELIQKRKRDEFIDEVLGDDRAHLDAALKKLKKTLK